jgi:molybdate transport system regulatory protein
VPKLRNRTVGARLRIVLGPDIAIGPGKAAILEGVKQTGSIAAAGRRMHMSYKRAWHLVRTVNRCFKVPLVAASKGGRRGGGAQLTPLGEEVLRRYRHMESRTARVTAADLQALRKVLAVRRSR